MLFTLCSGFVRKGAERSKHLIFLPRFYLTTTTPWRIPNRKVLFSLRNLPTQTDTFTYTPARGLYYILTFSTPLPRGRVLRCLLLPILHTFYMGSKYTMVRNTKKEYIHVWEIQSYTSFSRFFQLGFAKIF